MKSSRRSFLEAAALAASGAPLAKPAAPPETPPQQPHGYGEIPPGSGALTYPRIFTGRHLAMIAFPLGGVGAGSLALGGRGQLRDWEIFNRPDKGNSPSYALPAIWCQLEDKPPVARVLEARYQPPYEGQDGLGSQNAPGLSRLESARFRGEFPFAGVDFEDRSLPVNVALEAFSPFIPHAPDDSGLPVAILHYRVRNPNAHAVRVSIAWSIENPVHTPVHLGAAQAQEDTRANEFRHRDGLSGLFMSNPGLPDTDPLHGSFVLALRDADPAAVTYLKGWPKGRWWNSPLLFWDDFSADGKLGPEPAQTSPVGTLCLTRTIPAGASASYEFILAWHFPNRTPARCGWSAPKGHENTVIGNWYATRFSDAWEAASYAADHLPALEKKTRLFADSLRESTLPAAVRDAASANLSTLTSTTCFRTADGAFHGFEGVDDHLGCCFGNCTHVWNYETATAHLFPSFARSLRQSAFGYSMDDAGAMHFRQLLPDGMERSGFAAADGQMGQIIHAYLDWILSGDRAWLESLWPRIKKAISFAWVPGGWDANRDGVMEGVQHNTYDVEFYGPNPQCGIYYLGALRACQEMAATVGDTDFSRECARLFTSGSHWIDANLFNGQYYIQQVRGYRNDQIAPNLRSNMGADNPEHPEYQVGQGCLVDQLVGQYLADVCGLGSLVQADNVHKTLASVARYNGKPTLYNHNSVQRTFALNDESALVICDYATAARPRIPFPYFAEVMTGFEYTAASLMLYAGMVPAGVKAIADIRMRYDGERRNPWDEAECGHHYARAMSAWTPVLALSGFRYRGDRQHLSIQPAATLPTFRCFWSNATAWGVFTRTAQPAQYHVQVHSGALTLSTCELDIHTLPTARATRDGTTLKHRAEPTANGTLLHFSQPVTMEEGEEFVFNAGA
jgi:uncharacterized protein (DUF608 family)